MNRSKILSTADQANLRQRAPKASMPTTETARVSARPSASGLRNYSKAEARAIEAHWVKHMPDAGKTGKGRAPLNSVYGEHGDETRDRVLEVIKEHGPITVIGILAHTPDLPKRTVRTCVVRLSERAMIKQVQRAVWVAV